MNIFVTCFIISCAIVYIYDFVEFPKNLFKTFCSRILNKTVNSVRLPKLLECSLCATTWITLIILLIFEPKFCYLALVYGFSTKYILYTIQIVDNLLTFLLLTIDTTLTKLKNLTLNI